MVDVRRTAEFIDWIMALRDVSARARIAKRIDRIAQGNFGDVKSVGDKDTQDRDLGRAKARTQEI